LDVFCRFIILKEYSEVILADQAQKLTDIIDGIIKSFKHDNKILKHIEDGYQKMEQRVSPS
jgi:hypothetical protein